jgi:hypothetical protein
MKSVVQILSRWRHFCVFVMLVAVACPSILVSQDGAEFSKVDAGTPLPTQSDLFRIETIPVSVGGELITIFAKQKSNDGAASEIPLLSLFRDTLGDSKAENDRLRYVWWLSYTKPTFGQKAAAFVPFLYRRTSNRGAVGSNPPPPILDVQKSDKALWGKVFWFFMRKTLFSEFGFGVRTPAQHYRQNVNDYRQSAIAASMALLSIYQETESEEILSQSEIKDIQARLALSDKTFGWHVESENLKRVHDKELTYIRDHRGHNWELLRQYSEAQGLWFEPLIMPDGSARHAIVWTTLEDVQQNAGKKFDSRFLNIKSPWNDKELVNWKGYTRHQWYDADDRQVDPCTPSATKRTMIPLAVYGLDHPKIPTILVDFRDQNNPKRREMSKRVLGDITSNVLALSQFTSVPYFLGRMFYEFATGRRGMDLNQPSRLRSYAQLKLLLSLQDSLDDTFRDEIAERAEASTLNPLQNDVEAEARLARSQYSNLLAYAQRPDGLGKKILNDRREEMARLKHGSGDRALFSIAHAFTFGLYTHREDSSPEMLARLDTRRQLDHHERFIREVAYSSAGPEIDANTEKLTRSLTYLAQFGSAAEAKTTRALAQIFRVSSEMETRRLCVAGLYRINNSSAKRELLAIYHSKQVPDVFRDMSAHFLKLALEEGQHMSARDARTVAGLAASAAN